MNSLPRQLRGVKNPGRAVALDFLTALPIRPVLIANSPWMRLLEVIAILTSRRVNGYVLDYLTDAMVAHLHGQAAPSLLPSS